MDAYDLFAKIFNTLLFQIAMASISKIGSEYLNDCNMIFCFTYEFNKQTNKIKTGKQHLKRF